MKKLKLLFILFYGLTPFLFSQSTNDRIKVYLLGTFHFAQTDSSYDVLSEKNQKSISKLCEIIKIQRPDKVFIERMPDFEYQNKMDSFYQAFKLGDSRNRRNEIWQVAFRVARDLNHKTIYSCDHPGQYGFLYSQIEEYASNHQQTDLLNGKGNGITNPVSSLINEDSLLFHSDLLDYMRWLNSKKVQQSSHAHYISVYPQLGNTNVFFYDSYYFLGSDLTVDWYRRNIKIYSKMIAQLDYKEEAIFLIMGNDHIPIIRHLFESNPYFEVMDTENWLGKTKIRMKQ
ncbi:MAG: hypothetical protein IPI50_10155 [Saprospiraceae bacterium]|nr:hypothetical protein [Saprospiraceae bacterium]